MSLIMTMEHDQHQEHGSAYHDPTGQWTDSGNVYHSQHQSPVHEYNGFAYNPMPMEPMYAAGSMPPPRTTHQALQPLIMPQWPSMLTSQSTYVPPLFPSAPLPAPPVSAPLSAPATTGRHTSSTPRKTLTDADRRRMCLYAEEHPTVKQTEIGAMFGVERSTVSKVLRNKEKYLHQEDGSRSPVRKAKGKFPDIERALSNWAKNHQRQGLPLTDALIKEKFRFFATTVGSSESLPKANNNSWLEKFKQKNNLMGSKSRKGSFVDEIEGASNPGSGSHSPNNTSPTSPQKEGSPTAMSVTKSEDAHKTESPDTYVDFSAQGHKPYHSLSNASLASTFTDGAHSSSFSPAPQSPTSPFFAPETTSPFIPQGTGRLVPANIGSNYSRPRSQTFPMLGVEPYVSPPSSEPLTPKYVSSTVLESPMTEMSNPLATVDEGSVATMQPPPPPHSTMSEAIITTSGISAPMLQTQATPSLTHSSPITPSSAISSVPPGSPTLEETRRALEVVMSYLQHQPSITVEPKELITMGGLMERLKLQGSRQGSVSAGVSTPGGIGVEMPGGMHRIPSGDFKNMLARE